MNRIDCRIHNFIFMMICKSAYSGEEYVRFRQRYESEIAVQEAISSRWIEACCSSKMPDNRTIRLSHSFRSTATLQGLTEMPSISWFKRLSFMTNSKSRFTSALQTNTKSYAVLPIQFKNSSHLNLPPWLKWRALIHKSPRNFVA